MKEVIRIRVCVTIRTRGSTTIHAMIRQSIALDTQYELVKHRDDMVQHRDGMV